MKFSWFRDVFLGRPRRSEQRKKYVAYPRPARSPSPPSVSDLPRFQGTANDAVGVVPRGTVPDPRRSGLRRAFTPSQPISDIRMFAGRRDLLLSLIRAVEEQQLHAVIFGDRGIGKTSLLHVFGQLAREARYLTRYISCSETSDFDSTFRAIAADIPLLYHSDFDPTSDAAEQGRALDSMLPSTPVNVAQVSDLFAKLAGTRVLIILDEFDRTRSLEFRRSIAELIKNLSDRAIRVQVVIAGVAANLTELVEHIPSIRRNVVGIPVTLMNDTEIVEILRLAEATSGLSFDTAAVQRIVDVAHGSPYLAGLIGQNAGMSALDRRAPTVGDSDVKAAVRQCLKDVSLRISQTARLQLERLASEASPAQLAKIARLALDQFGLVGAGDALDPRSRHVLDRALALGLVTASAIDDAPSYQFLDDSVPLYLWLSSADHDDAND